MRSINVAVRIARNVAASGYTWTNEDFYEDETMRENVPDNQGFSIQYSQYGKPTKFLLDDNYKKLSIQFILNRSGTLQKLKNIRDWISNGGRLLVYPAFKEQPDLYYDCIIEPGSIPDHIFLKGYAKAREVLTVKFLEFQKNAAIVEEEA